MASLQRRSNFRTRVYDNGAMPGWPMMSVYYPSGVRHRTWYKPGTGPDLVPMLIEHGARFVVLDGDRAVSRVQASELPLGRAL